MYGGRGFTDQGDMDDTYRGRRVRGSDWGDTGVSRAETATRGWDRNTYDKTPTSWGANRGRPPYDVRGGRGRDYGLGDYTNAGSFNTIDNYDYYNRDFGGVSGYTDYDSDSGIGDLGGMRRTGRTQQDVRGGDLNWYPGWWRPRSDILEDGDNYIIEFELPGVPRDNIRLTVGDDHVILTTVKPQSNKERRGFYYQNERHFGNFYRRLHLPDTVNTSRVAAVYDNGVLKVTLPKSDIGVGGTKRKIDIGAGDISQTEGNATTTTATTRT